MLKKHTWKIAAAVVIILMAGAFYWSSVASKKANEGIVVEDHIIGNPDATVTLTEYSDFQCPACGQFNPVVEQVLATYGDQIRFEYKHFPLISIHQFALPAAKAAEAAGQQGKFFEMSKLLFQNQATWSVATNPQVYFIKYAEDLGLDLALFKIHMTSSILEDRIKRDFGEARDLNLTGTPTFFLNGQQMQIESFQGFIDDIASAIGTSSIQVGN